MKTEIKKLAGLIELALRQDVLYNVSCEEIIQAIDALERSLYRQLNCSLHPELVKKYLDELSFILSSLIFNIGNGLPGITAVDCRLVVNRVNILYKKVNTCLECYHPAAVRNAPSYSLLPLNTFFKTAARVAVILEERFSGDELYSLLHPYINALHSKNPLLYHRWLWWMHFFSVILNTRSNENILLQEVLTALNFNTPGYISWLQANLENEIAAKPNLSEKLGYLSHLLIQYKLKEAWEESAFNAAAPSVTRSLIFIIKTEIKNIHLTPEPMLPQRSSAGLPEKLGTSLSVPQLALFVRLLVDTNIINQQNQSSLLTHIAAIMHTAKAPQISPESLRINYYTPNTAAKNIVKEYLINMINRLKNY